MSNQTVVYFSSLIKGAHFFTPKEKEILLFRLKKKTLKKIGRKQKVTAEWIRQIEKSALKKFTKKINQLMLFD